MASRKRIKPTRKSSRGRKRRTRARTEPSAPSVPVASTGELDVETAPASDDGIVVGVGASAGGLEAFSQLLQALPDDPGFAMVFVQHLAPKHESALPELLAARTDLPVLQATEGMLVERDHVYVIPPNIQMIIDDGRLHLTPRPSDRSQ